MKKSLVLMAMAGVALVGCVNDVAEVAQDQEQKKTLISFQPPVLYNNVESRANYHNDIEYHETQLYTYPKDEDFMIYADQYTGSFSAWDASDDFWKNGVGKPIRAHYNESYGGWFPVELNGTTYEYKYYHWPSNGDKLAFAAYSPADLQCDDAVVSYDGTNGLQIQDFKVSEVGQQFDLLYSPLSEDNSSDKIQIGVDHFYNGIPIHFKHALSSIHFAIENSTSEEAGLEVKLKSVKLYGIFNMGNFIENASGNKWNSTGNLSTIGVGVHAAYTLKEVDKNNAVIFPRASRHVLEAVEEQNKINVTNAFSLRLIPQSLDNAYIEVEYWLGRVKGTNSDGSKVIEWDDTPKKPAPIPLKGRSGEKNTGGTTSTETVNAWNSGYRYTYLLKYGTSGSAKDLIYFAPQTELWTDIDNIVLEIGQ